MPENSKELYKQRLEILTKVDVMPAQAPAASLPNTDSSPSFPLNNFWPKIKTLDSIVKWYYKVFKIKKTIRGQPYKFHMQKAGQHYKVSPE